MPESFFACSSSGILRSCSQKKRASASRAASTRALPCAIASPPSFAAMLATQTNAGASRPSSLVQAKYFWLVRMVSTITSRGTSRNSASKRPTNGTGHSVSPAFSTTSPSSASSVSPASFAAASAPSRMMPLALLLVDDHMAGAELLDIVGRAADGDVAGVVEAVADGRGAARDAVDLDRHDVARRAWRRCRAAAGPSAGRRRPSASIWAKGSRRRCGGWRRTGFRMRGALPARSMREINAVTLF